MGKAFVHMYVGMHSCVCVCVDICVCYKYSLQPIQTQTDLGALECVHM